MEREDSGCGLEAMSEQLEPTTIGTRHVTENGLSGIAGGLVPETPSDRTERD